MPDYYLKKKRGQREAARMHMVAKAHTKAIMQRPPTIRTRGTKMFWSPQNFMERYGEQAARQAFKMHFYLKEVYWPRKAAQHVGVSRQTLIRRHGLRLKDVRRYLG